MFAHPTTHSALGVYNSRSPPATYSLCVVSYLVCFSFLAEAVQNPCAHTSLTCNYAPGPHFFYTASDGRGL